MRQQQQQQQWRAKKGGSLQRRSLSTLSLSSAPLPVPSLLPFSGPSCRCLIKTLGSCREINAYNWFQHPLDQASKRSRWQTQRSGAAPVLHRECGMSIIAYSSDEDLGAEEPAPRVSAAHKSSREGAHAAGGMADSSESRRASAQADARMRHQHDVDGGGTAAAAAGAAVAVLGAGLVLAKVLRRRLLRPRHPGASQGTRLLMLFSHPAIAHPCCALFDCSHLVSAGAANGLLCMHTPTCCRTR